MWLYPFALVVILLVALYIRPILKSISQRKKRLLVLLNLNGMMHSEQLFLRLKEKERHLTRAGFQATLAVMTESGLIHSEVASGCYRITSRGRGYLASL